MNKQLPRPNLRGNWLGLLFAGFVFGEVGAAFVVVEVVVDRVVLAGVATGDLGAAAVLFLVLGLGLLFVVHMGKFSRDGRALNNGSP